MGISLFIGRLVTPYAEKAFASLDFQSRGPRNRRKRSSDLLTMKSQLCTCFSFPNIKGCCRPTLESQQRNPLCHLAKVHEGASCSRRGGFGCLCGSLQGHLFVSWWNSSAVCICSSKAFPNGPSLDDGMVY